jgi:hypothetical protein
MNSRLRKMARSLITFFPSGPIILPPIFVTTFDAGSSPMFFRTRKKNPLSSSTSRMTLGLSWLGTPAVVAPFD